MQIAVDGPAGSGKSSVCKIIAEKYGFIYIDTGAMYRSVAWLSINFGEDNLIEKVNDIDFILEDNGKKISIKYNNKIYDLTKDIRTPDISEKVPFVAANKEIRKILVEKQQNMAKSNNVIMEGRDITTVVLPNADIKIYLTASAEERAKRRFQEWDTNENSKKYEEVLNDIKKRDEIDTTRKESPLIKADDAILLDTTGLTLNQVADKIGEMIVSRR